MSDNREFLDQNFRTLQQTGQAIESGRLSIVEGGPVFKQALGDMLLFMEFTDEFWRETADWVLRTMAPSIIDQGAEYHAWRDLLSWVSEKMPEHVRNQPRG